MVMHEKDFRVRRFAMSDADEVIRLLKLSFGFHLSREWWDWKYTSNPAGFWGEQGDIWIAESTHEVVGHLAVMPQRMKIGPETVTVAQAVDGATHPRYRGLGISKTLVEKVWAEAKNRYGLIFGFPNEGMYRSFLRAEWKHSRVVEFYRLLNLDSTLQSYLANDLLVGAGKIGLRALRTVKGLRANLP
jgi:GNAT superfamily N-acetyltransferase